MWVVYFSFCLLDFISELIVFCFFRVFDERLDFYGIFEFDDLKEFKNEEVEKKEFFLLEIFKK